jgi:hypothetical protein
LVLPGVLAGEKVLDAGDRDRKGHQGQRPAHELESRRRGHHVSEEPEDGERLDVEVEKEAQAPSGPIGERNRHRRPTEKRKTQEHLSREPHQRLAPSIRYETSEPTATSDADRRATRIGFGSEEALRGQEQNE